MTKLVSLTQEEIDYLAAITAVDHKSALEYEKTCRQIGLVDSAERIIDDAKGIELILSKLRNA